MISSSLQEIEFNAQQFRKAMDMAHKAGKLPESMKDFPRGCCGDTAHLLGTYLEEKGFGEYIYVCGEKGSKEDDTWTSHAWIMQEELIIDITKSQFTDAPEGITVSSNSEWHNTFKVSYTCRSNIKNTGDQLEPYYDEIVKIIVDEFSV